MQSQAVIHILTILLTALILPILGGELLSNYVTFKFIDLPIHSLFESIGGFIALSMSAFLYYRSIHMEEEFKRYVWVITALSSMGIFDLFHAVLEPGNNFVWFHSLATFSGGLFFSMIWLSYIKQISTSISKKIFHLVFFSTIILCIYSMLLPQDIPSMLNSDGTFSNLAKFLNVGGGILFVFATLFFTLEYKNVQDNHELLFVGHTLLFGIAGILFNNSVLFDGGWWFWHFLRLIAYMFAQYFLILIFISEIKAHNQASKELQKANHHLQEEITLALNEQQAKQSLLAKESKINSVSAMISMVSNQWTKPLDRLRKIIEERSKIGHKEIPITEVSHELDAMASVINEFKELHALSKNRQSLRDALEAAIEIVSSLLSSRNIDIITHYQCLSGSKEYGSELTQVFLYLFQYITQKANTQSLTEAKIELHILQKQERQQQVIIKDNFSHLNKTSVYNDERKNPLLLAEELLQKSCQATCTLKSSEEGSELTILLQKES